MIPEMLHGCLTCGVVFFGYETFGVFRRFLYFAGVGRLVLLVVIERMVVRDALM